MRIRCLKRTAIQRAARWTALAPCLFAEGGRLDDGLELSEVLRGGSGVVVRDPGHGHTVDVDDVDRVDLTGANVPAARALAAVPATAVARITLVKSRSSGTSSVIAFPAYPPRVTSTGSEASRDAWADNAATNSSTVVTGVSGIVVSQ